MFPACMHKQNFLATHPAHSRAIEPSYIVYEPSNTSNTAQLLAQTTSKHSFCFQSLSLLSSSHLSARTDSSPVSARARSHLASTRHREVALELLKHSTHGRDFITVSKSCCDAQICQSASCSCTLWSIPPRTKIHLSTPTQFQALVQVASGVCSCSQALGPLGSRSARRGVAIFRTRRPPYIMRFNSLPADARCGQPKSHFTLCDSSA